jgi:hypothetical protein
MGYRRSTRIEWRSPIRTGGVQEMDSHANAGIDPDVVMAIASGLVEDNSKTAAAADSDELTRIGGGTTGARYPQAQRGPAHTGRLGSPGPTRQDPTVPTAAR